MVENQKQENGARYERILDAAADLIVHYGYDKTTVSDIARVAGISKGAIYLHFESKDALFEHLLMRELRQYGQNWLALIEADPLGGTMAGIYKNILYAMQQSPLMMALFKRDTHVLGSYVRKPDNMLRRDSGMRAEFLQVMKTAGAIREDVDVRVLAHIMNIFSYGLVSIGDVVDAETIPPLEAVIEMMGEMMDRMLAPSGDEQAISDAGKQAVRQLMEANGYIDADQSNEIEDETKEQTQ